MVSVWRARPVERRAPDSGHAMAALRRVAKPRLAHERRDAVAEVVLQPRAVVQQPGDPPLLVRHGAAEVEQVKAALRAQDATHLAQGRPLLLVIEVMEHEG